MVEKKSSGFTIKRESTPKRCEVCHQADMFDPRTGLCRRCAPVVTAMSVAFDRKGINVLSSPRIPEHFRRPLRECLESDEIVLWVGVSRGFPMAIPMGIACIAAFLIGMVLLFSHSEIRLIQPEFTMQLCGFLVILALPFVLGGFLESLIPQFHVLTDRRAISFTSSQTPTFSLPYSCIAEEFWEEYSDGSGDLHFRVDLSQTTSLFSLREGIEERNIGFFNLPNARYNRQFIRRIFHSIDPEQFPSD